ncbi:MAG: 30S ribosomal protein S1 [Spirochaetaceae bacterium]|nr:30S ribosomal protein S1 [Spirochaetaceae bacterium]
MTEKEAMDNKTQFAREIDSTITRLEEGSLIVGEVVQINNDYVYLDVGLKSEALVPRNDFFEAVNIGDKATVVLKSKEGKNGPVVSKHVADQKVLLKQLHEANSQKKPLKGKITKQIKGGFNVDIGGGIIAFLPVSKVDITSNAEDLESYLGLESYFYIDRFSESRGKINLVVTRRDYLLEESDKSRAKFFASVNIGDEIEGVVKSFTSFGAFVDLGGFDGLLHLNDMSWGHATRPKDYVKKDEKVKLKVVRLDPENKRINLSLKHFQDDPWSNFHERYNINDIIKGKVTKLADFGAFVEIEEGIEGLVHISELSWIKRVKHPKEILTIGDMVSVAILGYDTEAERISLGLKQATENPWLNIDKKYPVGTKINRVIKKVTNAGAFIELEEGIDAFLHGDDITWTKRAKSNLQSLKAGETIDAVVIDVVPAERRIRLGIKQLSEDPWRALEAAYHRGEKQDGEISGKTEFGLFMRLASGIEGLIHRNNLTDDKTADINAIMANFNVGDKVSATIVEVTPDKKRLSLSIRDLREREERQELKKYINNEDDEKGSTLGDFFS